MSTQYDVVVNLMTRGSLDAGLGVAATRGKQLDDSLGRARGKADGLGAAMAQMGNAASSVAGAFTSVVERVADVGIGLAKVGVVAAGVGLAHGVVKLNNELEGTRIGIGAILNAQGAVPDMNAGMMAAGGLMAQMRADAAALPGTTKDLQKFFSLGLNPGLLAGANPMQIEKLSASAMAASAATQVPMEQAAREFGMLLQGRSGSHNILGMQLGFSGAKAEEFNKATGAERMKLVTDAVSKFDPAIKEYAHSFEGLSTSLVDTLSRVEGRLTKPLFESVKKLLERVNGANWDGVMNAADVVGEKIAHGFEWGVRKVEEWWPAISTFAHNAETRLAEIWTKIEPLLSRLAEKGKDFLGDPASIDKIGNILKLYAAVKIGGPLLGGGLEFGKMLGMLGGGAGEAGALGIGGGAALTAALVAIPVAVAAIGAVNVATDPTNPNHDDATVLLGTIEAEWAETLNHLSGLWKNVSPVVDAAGIVLLGAITGVVTGLELATGAFASLGGGITDFVGIANMAIGTLGAAFQKASAFANYKPDGKIVLDETKITFVNDKTKAGGGGGGGGTHIQKVELVVTGNDDPARVARHVIDLLSEKTRNPISSRFVTNWSSGR